MTTLPLHLIDGHLFLVVENDLWVIDTGAPSGFGESRSITIADRTFDLGDNYLGMDAETLSDQVGTRCVGLLGADVLGEFDHLFDVPNKTLTVSSERLDYTGQIVPVEHFMGWQSSVLAVLVLSLILPTFTERAGWGMTCRN